MVEVIGGAASRLSGIGEASNGMEFAAKIP